MKYIALGTVFYMGIVAIWNIRKYPKLLSITIYPFIILALYIALMTGCTPQEAPGSILNVPDENAIKSSDPSIETSIETDMPLLFAETTPDVPATPEPINDINDCACIEISCSAPQIIEVPVEVIVELPGQTVEVIKEVYVEMPLDGMDMRKRQLEFINELNEKYASVFGMRISIGDYSYNFTTKAEQLMDYHFVTASGSNIPCGVPLRKDILHGTS